MSADSMVQVQLFFEPSVVIVLRTITGGVTGTT